MVTYLEKRGELLGFANSPQRGLTTFLLIPLKIFYLTEKQMTRSLNEIKPYIEKQYQHEKRISVLWDTSGFVPYLPNKANV